VLAGQPETFTLAQRWRALRKAVLLVATLEAALKAALRKSALEAVLVAWVGSDGRGRGWRRSWSSRETLDAGILLLQT
jgi:hypothetical protein